MTDPVRRPLGNRSGNHLTFARRFGEVSDDRRASNRIACAMQLADTNRAGAIIDMGMVMHPRRHFGVKLGAASPIGIGGQLREGGGLRFHLRQQCDHGGDLGRVHFQDGQARDRRQFPYRS